MLERYTKPLAPYAPTILRLMVGLTFLLHGLGKVEHPSGFLTTVARLGFPAAGVVGWIPIIMEPLGGVLLLVGLLTRWVGLYFVVEMAITAFLIKAAHGTPFIYAKGTGYELDLLLLVGSLVLLLLGAGQLSLDQQLGRRRSPPATR
jgi:putative oxidoreductase